jgi:curli biogenesis system outer membrane secretion channel CsgG
MKRFALLLPLALAACETTSSEQIAAERAAAAARAAELHRSIMASRPTNCTSYQVAGTIQKVCY